MPTKHLFAAITKVNVEKRTVSGIAMQEILDRSGEVCLYLESKPFFEAWSDTQSKASGGKSKGNIREMHQPSAVGITLNLECDDEQKAFIIEAEIVDDDAWKKVEKGVYTGFSIGANFAEKPTLEKGVLYWVADPVEISLVDVPCVPSATFDLTKADGTTEKRKFTSTRKSITSAQRSKGMYSVSEMAYALTQIGYLASDLEYEAIYEGDDSQIPARLRAWLETGCELFLDLAEEETSEFAQMITAQKASRASDREKAGSGCTCSCTGCSDCSSKSKAANPQHTQQEQDDMTPEQQKAFDDGITVLKSLAPTLEALKGVPDSLKSIATTQTAQGEQLKSFDERLTAMEELKNGLEALEAAFSGEPEPAKTKHAAAVAVPRDEGQQQTQQNATANPAELKHSTKQAENRTERLSAIKSLHQTPLTGSGFQQ